MSIKYLFHFAIYFSLHSTVLAQKLEPNYEFVQEISLHSESITFLYQFDNQLYVGDESGKLSRWTRDGESFRLDKTLNAHIGSISHVVAVPSRNLIATVAYDGWVNFYSLINLTKVNSVELSKVLPYDGTNGNEGTSMVLSADEHFLFVCGYNREVSKINLQNFAISSIYKDPKNGFTSSTYLVNNDIHVFGIHNKIIFLDKLGNKTRELLTHTNDKFENRVCELLLLPKLNCLATWLVSGEIMLFNLSNGARLNSYKAGTNPSSCQFSHSPSEKHILYGNQTETILHNIIDNTKLRMSSAMKRTGNIGATVFSEDGSWFASGDSKGKVFIWMQQQEAPVVKIEKGEKKKIKENTESSSKISKDVLKKNNQFILEGVNFKRSSYILTDSAKFILNELVTLLRENKNVHILLEGHTSNEGNDAVNLLLSKRRLATTSNYLVTHGIEEVRIAVVAYGESKPLLPNDSKGNKKKNRRIEVRITKA
jgi:outer membrane protein OmpA-like peptidoglycan-associated protein